MKKRSAETLWDTMKECHKTGKHRTAIIVFKQSSFKEVYSETERSYASYSDQNGWHPTKMGHCRIGDCLDGKDLGVRLDWQDWDVDYWYWEDEA